MDASPVFVNLLRSIEESQLNYSMSRTPFSATISLKCSFLKRFSESSNISSVRNVVPTNNLLERHIEKLEAEKIELKEEVEQLKNTLENDQKRVMDELVYFKEVYEKEKNRSSDLESKIAEFREEVLTMKSEKKKLNVNLKSEKEECDALRMKTKVLEEEKKSLHKVVRDKVAALERKHAEVIKVSDEKETVKKAMIEVETELVNLRLMEQKRSKSQFECEICNVKVENHDLLKKHKLQNHSHHKKSQYEHFRDFECYSCFYCDLWIASEENLEDHFVTCQNAFAVMRESPLTHLEVDHITLKSAFQCEHCDAKCRDADDLKRHSKTYHGLELVNEEFERELFQCDICPLYYKKLIDLEFHERGCHWDHLWPEE